MRHRSPGWRPFLAQVNVSVVTKDGYVEIRLDKERAMALHQQLKHAVLDDATLSKYCLTRMEGNEATIYLRLPQKDGRAIRAHFGNKDGCKEHASTLDIDVASLSAGEYALKLFAQDEGAVGEADNVLNYLIEHQGTAEGGKPFPNTTHGILGKGPDADKFGVKPISHPGGTIDAKGGKVSVKFKAKDNAELVCEVHTVDGKAAQTVTATRRNENGEWVFDLDLPDKGEYSLNVFAKEKGNENEIFNVHTYLVESEGHAGGGQGDGGDSDADSAIRVETVETSDKEVFIPVPPGCDPQTAMAEFHRRNGQNGPETQRLELIDLDGMQMFRIHLDDYGEYMLNVYTGQGQEGRVQNVAKYQVNRRRPGELYSGNINTIMDTLHDDDNKPSETAAPTPEPSAEERKRMAKKQVQQAMDLKDQKQLEAAIARYKDLGVPDDDPVLVRAQKLLKALKAKADLMEASQKRDLKALEAAIKQAKEVNFEHQLDVQIALATRLKDHLQHMEKLRHAVLNMDQKVVAELKTYGSPPDGVHQSMMATFLLLGSALKEVKVWKTCQALMSKTGKESMMRKISQFNPRAVPIKVAEAAKKVIAPYSKEQIRDASAGAATFFIWRPQYTAA
nr:hypothetical protein BaRGS_015907 [Batillaria attramentaria]